MNGAKPTTCNQIYTDSDFDSTNVGKLCQAMEKKNRGTEDAHQGIHKILHAKIHQLLRLNKEKVCVLESFKVDK